jgi:hypothetical protein
VDRLHDLLVRLRRMSPGRKRDHVPHDFGRIGGVVDQRLRAEGDLVAEDGGDFVRVSRAADVAQQRDPIDGFARFAVETGFLGEPCRQQARAELRFERLAERVVLRQGQRRDELGET